jgi:hypothetical protein
MAVLRHSEHWGRLRVRCSSCSQVARWRINSLNRRSCTGDSSSLSIMAAAPFRWRLVVVLPLGEWYVEGERERVSDYKRPGYPVTLTLAL